jgi:hypothetical protein
MLNPPNVHPFKTKRDVIRFAKIFIRRRVMGFRKDIDICLTANHKRSHAYMPGLMATLSFLDLLSGLYAGKVEGHNDRHFLDYAKAFMPPGRYNPDELKILYIGFRHKLAHLSHPYFVFDTSRDIRNRFKGMARKRVAWTICAAPRKQPLELIAYAKRQRMKQQPTPRNIYYDHRIKVSIRSLATDAMKTVRGPNGYLKRLETSPALRARFRKCMSDFYPV